MPVSANKLIVEVRRKVNSVNAGKGQSFRVVDIVMAINEAYMKIVEQLVSVKDQNDTIRNHLRPLLVSRYKLECKATNDPNVCEITYPSDYYETVRMRAKVSKADCCEGLEKEITIKVPQGDDVDEARNNPYRRSNFYFEQLLGYQTSSGLQLFHDLELDIEEISMDYLKRIDLIQAPEMVKCADGTYKDWDGNTISENVDLILDATYIEQDLTDIAAVILAGDSEQYNKAIAKLQRDIQINQLYK